MSQNIFSICDIVVPDDEDYQFLIQHLGNYPVRIFREKIEQDNIPTMIVGWSQIKEKFPIQNIFDKTLGDNLYWTYSQSEDKKLFLSEIEEFFFNPIFFLLKRDSAVFFKRTMITIQYNNT